MNFAWLDRNWLWRSARGWPHCLYCLHYIFSLCYLTEYHMLSVKPRSISCGNEKLTSICVFSGICHRQTKRLMFQVKVLVFEFIAPYWNSSSSVSPSEIPTLNHEIGNYSMEFATLVSQLQAFWLLGSLAKGNKVFNCFRDNFSKHIYNNISSCLSIYIYRECDSVSCMFLL